ncbi:hypothetical protein ABZ215_41980 [Amycolatopsis sp. NPDC006131]|uniref:hypothetical protein n=1 Tax=Amycolatopsis sp. NPDC006131 TaxID=3156731 RepID=UPI0033BA0BAF
MPDIDAITVGSVMRAPALTAPADADVAEVATGLVDSHQRCLPVSTTARWSASSAGATC